jgi:hypothetical protein
LCGLIKELYYIGKEIEVKCPHDSVCSFYMDKCLTVYVYFSSLSLHSIILLWACRHVVCVQTFMPVVVISSYSVCIMCLEVYFVLQTHMWHMWVSLVCSTVKHKCLLLLGSYFYRCYCAYILSFPRSWILLLIWMSFL